MSARKIATWHDAGLIDAGTRDRLLAYEAEHARPLVLWAIYGIGALAIGLGFVSVVAANWEDIPGLVRLSVHLALIAGMIPVALGIGEGADFRAPLGRAVRAYVRTGGKRVRPQLCLWTFRCARADTDPDAGDLDFDADLCEANARRIITLSEGKGIEAVQAVRSNKKTGLQPVFCYYFSSYSRIFHMG